MNASSARALRKLNLIRLLMSHPRGISFEALTSAMGFNSESELKKELGQLYMIESYPYSPMDFAEVEFDGDLVKLRLPVPLEKSLPLTPLEWSTLRAIVLKALESEANKQVLEGVLSKINTIIPTQTWTENTLIRPIIEEGIREKTCLTFLYWKRTNDELETRNVVPLTILDHLESYLLSYDLDKQSFRAFRLDCISELKLNENLNQLKLPEGWDEWKKEFLKLLNQEKTIDGQTATIWATDSAGYHLGRRLPLQKTGKTKQIKNTTYLEFNTTIPEESWFVDTILSYGTSVFLTAPKVIKERIQSSIL